MGIGDWGLGIGDWAQSPIPNPQSPIPNPHELYKLLGYYRRQKTSIYLESKRSKCNINKRFVYY